MLARFVCVHQPLLLPTKIVPSERLQRVAFTADDEYVDPESIRLFIRGRVEGKSGDGRRTKKDRQRSNVSTEFVTGIRNGGSKDREREKGLKRKRATSTRMAWRYGDLHSTMQTFLVNN